ncbi:MAG: hypothetical protein J3K34DRAFT_508323 [Monoraphidium minutum]|nr:MAG: hypothetical protein J3K34DRAFT_508323 [Monoraphidium minutum]
MPLARVAKAMSDYVGPEASLLDSAGPEHLARSLGPANTARLLSDVLALGPRKARRLLRQIGPVRAADMLSALGPAGAAEAVALLGPGRGAAALITVPGPGFGAAAFNRMGPPAAADLLSRLGPTTGAALLRAAGAVGAGRTLGAAGAPFAAALFQTLGARGAAALLRAGGAPFAGEMLSHTGGADTTAAAAPRREAAAGEWVAELFARLGPGFVADLMLGCGPAFTATMLKSMGPAAAAGGLRGAGPGWAAAMVEALGPDFGAELARELGGGAGELGLNLGVGFAAELMANAEPGVLPALAGAVAAEAVTAAGDALARAAGLRLRDNDEEEHFMMQDTLRTLPALEALSLDYPEEHPKWPFGGPHALRRAAAVFAATAPAAAPAPPPAAAAGGGGRAAAAAAAAGRGPAAAAAAAEAEAEEDAEDFFDADEDAIFLTFFAVFEPVLERRADPNARYDELFRARAHLLSWTEHLGRLARLELHVTCRPWELLPALGASNAARALTRLAFSRCDLGADADGGADGSPAGGGLKRLLLSLPLFERLKELDFVFLDLGGIQLAVEQQRGLARRLRVPRLRQSVQDLQGLVARGKLPATAATAIISKLQQDLAEAEAAAAAAAGAAPEGDSVLDRVEELQQELKRERWAARGPALAAAVGEAALRSMAAPLAALRRPALRRVGLGLPLELLHGHLAGDSGGGVVVWGAAAEIMAANPGLVLDFT